MRFSFNSRHSGIEYEPGGAWAADSRAAWRTAPFGIRRGNAMLLVVILVLLAFLFLCTTFVLLASRRPEERKGALFGLLPTLVFVLLAVWAGKAHQRREANAPLACAPEIAVREFFENGRTDVLDPAVLSTDKGRMLKEWKAFLAGPLAGTYQTPGTQERRTFLASGINIREVKIACQPAIHSPDGTLSIAFRGSCRVPEWIPPAAVFFRDGFSRQNRSRLANPGHSLPPS